MFELLLYTNKIDINQENYKSQTILTILVFDNNYKCLKTILNLNLKLNLNFMYYFDAYIFKNNMKKTIDAHGTVLTLATKKNNCQCVDILCGIIVQQSNIEKGISVQCKDITPFSMNFGTLVKK